MYLSSLLIDTGENPDRQRPGRTWLRNRYHVHQRLCMAFPSDPRRITDPQFLGPFKPEDFEEGQVHIRRVSSQDGLSGFLFRVDPRPGCPPVILVQSAAKPNWEYAFQNASFLLAAPPQVVPFDPSYEKGQSLRFRLVANPTRKIDTKSAPDGTKRNGRRVPVSFEQLVEWLSRKGEVLGFAVQTASVQDGYVYFSKPGKPEKRDKPYERSRLRYVRFEGTLVVTDPDLFRREAIIGGVGSGKGFGFGLLSVAPYRGDA